MKKVIAVILTIIILHPNPLLLGAVHNEDAQFKLKLKSIGVPDHKVDQYHSAIKQAASMTKIDQALIAALIKTESDFNERAVSKKGGYFGAMQIPYKIFDIRKNVLMGTFILEDKINISKGNLKLALTKYKGWKNPKEGEWQANMVLAIYKQLKEKGSEKSART